jgi:hypothetical protein
MMHAGAGTGLPVCRISFAIAFIPNACKSEERKRKRRRRQQQQQQGVCRV